MNDAGIPSIPPCRLRVDPPNDLFSQTYKIVMHSMLIRHFFAFIKLILHWRECTIITLLHTHQKKFRFSIRINRWIEERAFRTLMQIHYLIQAIDHHISNSMNLEKQDQTTKTYPLKDQKLASWLKTQYSSSLECLQCLMLYILYFVSIQYRIGT